jgi:hypothetical protein
MINLIAIILGASLAVLYVGFLAISIGKLALLVIVVICLCLMAYSTFEDLRDEWKTRR